MKLPCEVIMDLIPLCKDGVASDESCRLVKEHIAVCSSCLKEYESMEGSVILESSMPDEKEFLQKLRRSVFKLQGVLLVGGAVLGVSMTFSMKVFYNFLLMPIVGILAFFVFSQRFYIAPALVFILSIISNTIYGLFGEKLGLTAFGAAFASWIMYSVIYALLVQTGWCIGWLLDYAFGKDTNNKVTYKNPIVKYIGIIAGILALIVMVALFLKSFVIM